MALTRQEVEHIAQLARLELTAEEIELFREQLSSVLEYVARLDRLDTAAISPTATTSTLRGVMRSDQAGQPAPREDMLTNAPSEHEGCFLVPPVLGSDDDWE